MAREWQVLTGVGLVGLVTAGLPVCLKGLNGLEKTTVPSFSADDLLTGVAHVSTARFPQHALNNKHQTQPS